MASQRLFIATLAGRTAVASAEFFTAWRESVPADHAEDVDRFCASIRENSTSLQVIYFSEWIDRWLMGDRVPGPGKVEGRRYETTSFTREQATAWATRCGNQYQEVEWLAARIREAASAWSGLAQELLVVVAREVFEATAGDEEMVAAFAALPEWFPGSPPL